MDSESFYSISKEENISHHPILAIPVLTFSDDALAILILWSKCIVCLQPDLTKKGRGYDSNYRPGGG